MSLNKLELFSIIPCMLLVASCSSGNGSSNSTAPVNGALITYTYSIGNQETISTGESFTITATLTSSVDISPQTISVASLIPSSESITFSNLTTPCTISSTIPSCSITATIGNSTESGNYTLTMQTAPQPIIESNNTISFNVTSVYLNPMILITNIGHNGDFGGNIDNVDSFCNSNITRPTGDTRIYKAMLSGAGRVACTAKNCANGVADQTDWVLKPNTTYYRGDNTTVIFTTNESAIFTTWPAESAVASSSSTDRVWTGMGNDTWMQNETCNNWSSADDSGTIRGRAAFPTSNELSMMYSGPLQNCDVSYILYCVSQ